MLPAEELYTAVISTALLMLLLIVVIVVALMKYFRKKSEFESIEELLRKQELGSAYSVIEAQETERKKIAADIHDNVGNLLATLKMYSDLILQQESDPEQKRLNEKINDITELVTSEIRKISHSLDSGTVQSFGLKAATAHLIEAVQHSGKLSISHFYDTPHPISSERSLHLYRIIQELITNTLKHARATRARLDVSTVNGDINLIYEDNGVGFDTSAVPEGIGLRNIRHRVSHLNGDLKIESSGQGTTFIIDIPDDK